MRRFLFLAVVALVACRGAKPHPRVEGPVPLNEGDERGSLTNIARGATIVSRSGEAFFETSAAEVIDGDSGTYWVNPPNDYPQSIVIGLPARARIDRIGLRTARRGFTANHVQFEASRDGAGWQQLANVTAAANAAAQWFDVAPVEASFLRVTVVDPPAGQSDVRLHSVLARGTELEPPRVGALDGCWSINGRPAAFAQHGARVAGALAIGDQPLFLDGGSDGRVVRFVWIRGNDYGLALMSVSPDGKHLTALDWHEEAIPMFHGDPWFGSVGPASGRGPAEARAISCGTPALREDVAVALLRRAGRYSAFGLRFHADGTLDADESREAIDMLVKLLTALRVPASIVVHEFREATPPKNMAKARRELESVRAALGANAARVTFVASGSEAPRQEPVTEAMRAMYSSVDLEIRR